MRPLRMIIPGEYWDSQIYAGRLYLFRSDGALVTLNWDKLLAQLKINEDDRVLFELPFRRSDSLYRQVLMHDESVRDIVRKKFLRLARKPLVVERDHLQRNALVEQNPLAFPHADSAIYSFRLYAVGPEGVYSALGENVGSGVGFYGRAEKHWDGPVLATAVGYGALGLAAGDAGLWDMTADPEGGFLGLEPRQVVDAHVSACGWVGWSWQSLYGSSPLGQGVLGAFHVQRGPSAQWPSSAGGSYARYSAPGERVEAEEGRAERHLDRIFRSGELFSMQGDYSWGSRDKLFQAHGQTLEAIRYLPKKFEGSHDFRDLAKIRLQAWKGEIVAAGSAAFGVVLEAQNALVVVPSTGRVLTFPGEPVNWRVFPRSRRYTNQLHIIYEDRLEVLAFTHDYFVNNQLDKDVGIAYWERQPSMRQLAAG